MRHLSFAAATLCLLLVVPRTTRAGQIIYDIQNYPTEQVDSTTGTFDHNVSGTITTDGTIGALTPNNILSWSVTFDGSFTFSTSLDPGATTSISGVPTATSTQITLPPASGFVLLSTPSVTAPDFIL
jgi:hypothetical protein